MSKEEKYRTAFNEACEMADRTRREVGLEWNSLFKCYNVIGLPDPENRRGRELRCQVVAPGTPRMA